MGILTILVTVFCSGYYYATTSRGSSLTTLFLLGYIGFACLGYIYRKDKIVLTNKRLIMIFIYLFSIVLSAVWNQSINIVTIKQILIVMCALFIVTRYSWKVFVKQYLVVMDCILVLALVGHVAIICGLSNYLPLVRNYNGALYYSAGLFSALTYQYAGVTSRMHGLFWEPGLLASYTLIALLLAEKEKNLRIYRIRFVLYSICIVLSGSGAGMLLMPIVWFIKWIDGGTRKYGNGVAVIAMIALISGIIVMSPYVDVIYDNEWLSTNLFNKLQDAENVSNAGRQNAILVDIDILLNNLPFGVGVDRYATELYQYEEIMSSSGTSTLTMMLAQYGIPALIIVIALLKGLMSLKTGSKWYIRLMTLAVFVFIFSKEPHNNLLLFNTLLLYLVEGVGNEKQYVLQNAC